MKCKSTPLRCPRKSSSGSDTDSPLRKRQHIVNMNMEDMQDMTQLTMKEVNLQDLYTLLIDVKSSQEQLKQGQDSFQKSVHSQISNLENKLDKNLESIQRQFEHDIQDVRCEMQRTTEKTKEQLDTLSREVDLFEMVAVRNDPEKSFALKLIFKNIKSEDIEDLEDTIYIRTYVESIIRAIELDPKIQDVEILNKANIVNIKNERSGKGSGATRKRAKVVTAVYFRNDADMHNVLKNKRKLKDNERFSHLYIEVDKTKHERQTEANIHKLLKTLPTLKLRGGRVVDQEQVTTVQPNFTQPPQQIFLLSFP